MTDIGMCFACIPPILVPYSDRAKAKMGLPEGACGAILLDSPVEELLSSMPEDWVCENIEIIPEAGDLIAVMTIKVLH